MAAERYEDNVDRLAGEPIDRTDRGLLAEVADMFDRIDPVPGDLVPRIEYELTLASLFDDVARLQRSNLELRSTAASGARSTAERIRTITFSGDDVSLMLTLSDVSTTEIRVDGWVAPGTGWSVSVNLPQHPQQSRTTDTDGHGRFAFPSLPAALAQFTLSRPDAQSDHTVTTPPIEL